MNLVRSSVYECLVTYFFMAGSGLSSYGVLGGGVWGGVLYDSSWSRGGVGWRIGSKTTDSRKSTTAQVIKIFPAEGATLALTESSVLVLRSRTNKQQVPYIRIQNYFNSDNMQLICTNVTFLRHLHYLKLQHYQKFHFVSALPKSIVCGCLDCGGKKRKHRLKIQN